MKKTLFAALLLAVALAPMALADEAATEATLEPAALALFDEAIEVAAAEAATAEAADMRLDAAGLPVSVLHDALETVNRAYECPAWTTYCWFDAQCDSFCGGSGGACTFGCCRCAF